MKSHLIALLLCAASSAYAQLGPSGATASFLGSLPPKPTADITAEQQSALEKELTEVTASFQAVKKHERAADADIFLKAVRYALEFHEWYDKKPEDGVKKATALLDEARKRIESLKKNETPWMNGSGQKVLGFYSNIDDSPQPYGVEVPEGLEWGQGRKPVPMWIWLHGRGDTATDLHFVYSRLMAKKPGQFQPKGTIVIHPFGRYCNGWKSAGETDVFEARDDAMKRFNVDDNRIALAGFSMGGAGAWHMGAHFADQWAVVHTGAGFADVKRYQKLTPEKMPPWYEQKLWGVYDVPDYARNFFNVPLISYSGEIDAQRDSAEYMMEVLGKEGLHPPHLIGAGMGHKYHPETIKEVQRLIEGAVEKGRNPIPKKVVLQCRAHRYAAMAWIEVLECEKAFDDTRIEAEITKDEVSGKPLLRITTGNVLAFHVDPAKVPLSGYEVSINGQKIEMTPSTISTRRPEDTFIKIQGKWVVKEGDNFQGKGGMSPVKAGGTSMEDALCRRFVIVLPEKNGSHPGIDQWAQGESQHFIRRWRSLMRGDPLIITMDEMMSSKSNFSRGDITLVLWGTPETNRLIADILDPEKLRFRTTGTPLPAIWTDKTVEVGPYQFDAAKHVLCAAYPRGLDTPRHNSIWDPWGTVIINSGLTFREAHDKTNSLQNPKLPDWAILDITQPPNAESAGKVVAADFFDEHWQVKPNMPPVDSK